MYLETYRESGSFKHFGYEPERDRDFGALYCAAATADEGSGVSTYGNPLGGTVNEEGGPSEPPTK